MTPDEFAFRQAAKVMLFIQPADAYTHEERLLINEACHRLGVGPPFPVRDPAVIVEEFLHAIQ